jgi:hypothetical protein
MTDSSTEEESWWDRGKPKDWSKKKKADPAKPAAGTEPPKETQGSEQSGKNPA